MCLRELFLIYLYWWRSLHSFSVSASESRIKFCNGNKRLGSALKKTYQLPNMPTGSLWYFCELLQRHEQNWTAFSATHCLEFVSKHLHSATWDLVCLPGCLTVARLTYYEAVCGAKWHPPQKNLLQWIPWSRALEKLTGPQLVKKFPRILWNLVFI